MVENTWLKSSRSFTSLIRTPESPPPRQSKAGSRHSQKISDAGHHHVAGVREARQERNQFRHDAVTMRAGVLNQTERGEREIAHHLLRRVWCQRYWPQLPPWFLSLPGASLSQDGCLQAGNRNRAARRQLTVLVRPPDRHSNPFRSAQPGAVPVQSGGAMCLDVNLNHRPRVFVWIDSEGQVLPLYPWNNESLEIKDINHPPPAAARETCVSARY